MAWFMYLLLSFSNLLASYHCEKQIGPDPWDYEAPSLPTDESKLIDIPPDLRILPKKSPSENNMGISDIFLKRVLGMVLRGGQIQTYEDGSVEVVLQMRFDSEKWNTLDTYMKSSTAMTESMLRKTMGYIEDAIYKPTVIEKIIMAWSDYVQFYLIEYKTYIVWTLGLLGLVLASIWIWNQLSHRHIILLLFIALYVYEGFISYKEAEQQELERFLTALSNCEWQFWKSTCEVPPPDIILFMKHMNPLKIAIRMFTTVVSEPLISLSAAINIMISGVTDGLWFPFNKIVYGFLILSFNALLIVFLIIIAFNYLLNIPFNLSFLGLSVGVKQRKRNLFSGRKESQSIQVDNTDRISGATLNKLLDVLSNSQSLTRGGNSSFPKAIEAPKIRRSASTSKLQNSSTNDNFLFKTPFVFKRKTKGGGGSGGGDAKLLKL